ncbi:MAG: DUF92 domain-containing protein [Chloroflexi bacterium]|nr:DUF92 domain-containing protein [Chloroflexota bacterium]
MNLAVRFLFGLPLSAGIAWLAWRRQALSGSGAAGTVLVGTVIFGAGGPEWGLLLILFFATSSALSRAGQARKQATAAEKFSKGSQRDLGQVLANGGLGALLALAYWLAPAGWLWAAFTGAMAAVNADTWATELGMLSRHQPRLITTGRRVETGTSGGVSAWGTLAALAGAAAIALGAAAFAALAGRPSPRPGSLLAAALAGGLAGALFDSLLGATVQRIYYCPACEKETERHPRHRCGAQTCPLRGWRWLDNDGVNFLCSAVGALAALIVWLA